MTARRVAHKRLAIDKEDILNIVLTDQLLFTYTVRFLPHERCEKSIIGHYDTLAKKPSEWAQSLVK